MSTKLVVRQVSTETIRPLSSGGRFAVAGLPAPMTRLVGRAADLNALKHILQDSAVRLVTLTGPGGVGKTRLAIALASQLIDEFADGAALVELAAVDDPALVATTILRALRRDERGDEPPAGILARLLSDRELLLVLDNFEHLLPAAPLLTELLSSCPRLKILATSRIRLRLRGEHEFPVDPLSVPDLTALPPVSELPSFGAIKLWTDRAKAANPAFALTAANAATVATICHRLDGLPLAIELAAARSLVLSPETILRRHLQCLDVLVDGPRDAPVRHRSMQAAIAWSFDLLGPSERALLLKLSVFAGGFSLEAAEAVVGHDTLGPKRRGEGRSRSHNQAGAPNLSVLDGIESLVGKSLLRSVPTDAEPRYAMLELVREFGLSKLAASEDDLTARHRHASYFVDLAEEAEPALTGAKETYWLARLGAEDANLRAARRWATENGEPILALRLGHALRNYWYRTGDPRESEEALDQALRAADASTVPKPLLAKTLTSLGWLAIDQGALERGAARLDEAIAICRGLGDRRGLARALHGLAAIAEFGGNDATAMGRYREVLALFHELGDRVGIGLMQENLADAAYRLNDLPQAAELAREALMLARDPEMPTFAAVQALVGAAQVACAQGEFLDAGDLLREAIERSEAAGYRRGTADALAGCAALAVERARPESAARLLAAAMGMAVTAGAGRVLHHTQYERALAAARGSIDEAAFAAAWAAGSALLPEAAITEAFTAIVQATTTDSPSSTVALGPDLTRRETEVLRLLAEGASDPDIADRLFISRYTASNHVHAILSKLGVANRAAAVANAIRRGLV